MTPRPSSTRTVARAAARAAGGAALAALALVGTADPAAADPAQPTDYRSEVTSVTPDTGALEIRVAGGDGFLELRVAPGHEVIVEGYQGEPYLRVSADGTVAENLRSEATYINADRYATTDAPDDLDPADEPEWRTIDDDGEYAWHDHRIHWMSPERPPGLQPGDVVYPDWQVPLSVDGEDVVVEGTLTWVPSSSPLPWFAGAVAVAAALVLGVRRGTVAASGIAVAVAGAAAAVVGAAENAAIPQGAGGSPLLVVIPALAVVAGLVAVWRRARPTGAIGALAGVALLAGWALLRVAVLFEPVLPTNLAPALDRAGTALALGIAAGVAVLVVRSGALRLPELPDD